MSNWRNITLTIANGATASEVLNLTANKARRPVKFVLYAPASGQTVTVQVAEKSDGTFVPLQSGGSNITLPDSKATQLDLDGIGAVKLVAGSAVSGDKVYQIRGVARR